MACLHLQRLSQPISALPIIFHPVLRTQLTLPPGLNFQARIIAGFSLFAPNVGVLSSKLSSPHHPLQTLLYLDVYKVFSKKKKKEVTGMLNLLLTRPDNISCYFIICLILTLLAVPMKKIAFFFFMSVKTLTQKCYSP